MHRGIIRFHAIQQLPDSLLIADLAEVELRCRLPDKDSLEEILHKPPLLRPGQALGQPGERDADILVNQCDLCLLPETYLDSLFDFGSWCRPHDSGQFPLRPRPEKVKGGSKEAELPEVPPSD